MSFYLVLEDWEIQYWILTYILTYVAALFWPLRSFGSCKRARAFFGKPALKLSRNMYCGTVWCCLRRLFYAYCFSSADFHSIRFRFSSLWRRKQKLWKNWFVSTVMIMNHLELLRLKQPLLPLMKRHARSMEELIKGNKCLKCGYQSTKVKNRRHNLLLHVRTTHRNELKVSFLYRLNLFL